MSAFARLRVVRIVLVAGVALRALAWGGLAGLTLIIGVALADLLVPLAATTRVTLFGVAVIASLITAAALVWRDRGVLSFDRVALWIEERFPNLDFALATSVEVAEE